MTAPTEPLKGKPVPNATVDVLTAEDAVLLYREQVAQLRDALGDMIHEFGVGGGWRNERQEAALKKAGLAFLGRQEAPRVGTAEQPLKLTPEAFEETARVITYQWMQHVGHGIEDIESYERQLDADVPVDEDDPNHEALREFEDTTELVVFAMERLVSLAEFTQQSRDPAAELRAAVKAFVDKHFHGGSKANRHDYVQMVPTADVFALVEALRAALAATEGEP